MSKFKIFAIIVIIALASGILVVGDALTEEIHKGRIGWYTVNWQQIEVGDQEGHVYAVYENKGIQTILQGKVLSDGGVVRDAGFLDMNLKTGLGSGYGICTVTERDGTKYLYRWEGQTQKPGTWAGRRFFLQGTGKYQGILGKGTWTTYVIAPGQSYTHWEGDVELPR